MGIGKTQERKTQDIKKSGARHALRYSIRIGGSVTSLSLRRNLVALWLSLNIEKIGLEDLQGKVSNFIYECLGKWKGDTGKGFSDFVSEMMIADVLDEDDFYKYQEILARI